MFVTVKNNSPAMQGVHTLQGVVWIPSGAKKTIEVADTRQLERLPFLDVGYTDAGVPLGDLPAPPPSLVAKVTAADPATMAMTKKQLFALAEERGVEVESDDNKAELVRKINA
jgi:hypothetical protein